MKKIIWLLMILSTIGHGQLFSDQSSQENNEEIKFFESQGPTAPPPQLGLDGEPPPAEDDVPLDEWIFLLPIIGIIVGAYYHLRSKETV